MDVERRAPPEGQQVVGHELTVGHQQQAVRGGSAASRSRPSAERSAPGVSTRRPLSRAQAAIGDGARPQPAAGRPIRLADDEQLVAERRQPGQERDAEGAGGQERDAADRRH